jgi:hypothetical protein
LYQVFVHSWSFWFLIWSLLGKGSLYTSNLVSDPKSVCP